MSVITVTVGSYTYDETQIIINPTISKSICSGGFSVGNTACGCLKVGVPNNGHSEGDSVKISYNGNQIMGEFFISDIEKCGYAKLNPTDTYKTQMVMLTCYDGMSKLDDYMTFSGTVTPADICDEIESQTGYYFKDGSKLGSSFEVTKEEAESRTMREWLGIFGCYVGCNWSLRTYWLNDVLVSRITQLPLYYSGNSFSAIINAPVTVENAVTFSRVVSRGKDGTFKSGTDSDYTLEISCQYATQDSNDIIQSNIENQAVPYTAFKCDKLKTDYISMDIGDVITLSGHSGGLKIYNQTVTISINGIYMSVGADVQKKTLKEDIDYSSGSTTLENVSNFQGGTSGNTGVVNLTWVKPSSAQNVIVKRKRSTPFNNAIDDGDIIAITSGNTLADTLPKLWYSYYYRTLTNSGDLYNGKDNSIMIPAVSRGKYLYNAGDLCTAITGGWNSGRGYSWGNDILFSGTANFETIDVDLNCLADVRGVPSGAPWECEFGAPYSLFGIQTVTKVDFTGFTKLCIEVEVTEFRTYDVTNGFNDGNFVNNAMPYYNASDGGGVDTAIYKYIWSSYRWTGDGHYQVWFFSAPPVLTYGYNEVQMLFPQSHAYFLEYDGSGNYITRGFETALRPRYLLPPPTSANLSRGNYMGGMYENGFRYLYAYDTALTPIVPKTTRFFVGTLATNNYNYTQMISKIGGSYELGTGTHVIKADITEINGSNFVCAGAFESRVKINAIWLEE